MAEKREKKARDVFAAAANGQLLTIPIENQADSGTPDSIISNRRGGCAWVEFKDIPDWPVRPGTVVFRGKFEKGQVPFLKQWQSWGGNGFVAARIAGTFYLFDVKGCHDIKTATKSELTPAVLAVGTENVIQYLKEMN